MAIYPGLTLTSEEIDTVVDYTTRIGLALDVRGLMNIQFVVLGGPAYRSPGQANGGRGRGGPPRCTSIEVNPRSSRTIPFISKVTGVPMVRLAINAMLGTSLAEHGYQGGLWKKQDLVGIKAPVFSMSKLAGVDTYLGPEMKSTGEVIGLDYEFGPAVTKALMAAGLMLPEGGAILLSIADRDKADSLRMVRDLAAAGYRLYATSGTAAMIRAQGIEAVEVPKLDDGGHPNVVDVIAGGTVDAVVNTLTGDREALEDGFEIRREAVERRIPCFTSLGHGPRRRREPDQRRRRLQRQAPPHLPRRRRITWTNRLTRGRSNSSPSVTPGASALPRALLDKYGWNDRLMLEEMEESVVLRGEKTHRLSWEETYRAMAAESEGLERT